MEMKLMNFLLRKEIRGIVIDAGHGGIGLIQNKL